MDKVLRDTVGLAKRPFKTAQNRDDILQSAVDDRSDERLIGCGIPYEWPLGGRHHRTKTCRINMLYDELH